ncbi:glycosyl hydrolase [Hufsiella ginkgonis]|uniref:Glycoside hydrolase n=1 Tax=Hufsiella ginkgonis TaxID=2695274 RepID=A0A7K1XW08_9SPHI|nr:glycosyl hydrolase [Hufsiella ginkgonis]MXV15162.1 glycoside hydrolase [Hufsiella ginkgonis]
MSNRRFLPAMGLLISLIYPGINLFAQENQLSKEFKNPPPAARPRVWWHWANSNVTKEGITKDFEWMKRVGIQGMQLGDVASGGGQTVEKKLVFGTPEWLDAVKHAAAEADRLGLEMAMFTSGGWSLTGGPWVKPEMAMKKLVWSETQLEGGKTLTEKLSQPPSAEGAGPLLRNGNRPNGYYKDYAVVAYRTPAAELAGTAGNVKASTSRGAVHFVSLADEDLSTGISVPADPSTKKAVISWTYDLPFKAKAITIAGRTGIPFGRVQASADGVNFKTLTTTPGKSGYRGGNIRTYAFPEVTARYFRFEMTNAPVRPADVISEATTLADTAYRLTELRLVTGARVNRWEDKAGFNFLFEYDGTATPDYPRTSVIRKEDVIDLTSLMAADGTLRWNAPAGNWTILRLGYALTGAKNRPAVPAALGYEVDKMDKEYVTEYMNGYTSPLVKALGPLYGKSMQYMVMDSWEAGIQNWTDKMPEEFMKRRAYAILPYLPALTGRVVESGEMSDRFLWDFRRTLVDLIAENHYGTVTSYLNKQGVKTYSEAGGVSLESIEDALLNKKYVDIPMGEFWVRDLHPSSMYYEDVRGAASASHVYGKGLVAAEAFTGGNYESPARLKSIADYWFTQGVNRLVFHTSAHQPLDSKPGNTMVGTHINRNITWAELAKPFMTYLSRNAYMLQRGRYAADILYLLNEGAPSTMPFWGPGIQPATPEGYSFDYINADALLSRVSGGPDGKLVLPDGLTYSVLVLPETQEMSLPVARKIRQLVQAGAVVVGPKPVKVPGLTAFPASDDELREIGSEVWGDVNGASRTVKTYGNGKIYWNQPLQKVLMNAGVPPDVDNHRSIAEVSFIHRIDGDTDIYLLVNRTGEIQDLDVKFRVSGKQPELWHATDGSSEPASYRLMDKLTAVNLRLLPGESVYVVFNGKATAPFRTVVRKTGSLVTTVGGPWQLAFPKGWGATDAAMQVDSLQSWTMHEDPGIKFFSGTATYTKVIDLKKKWTRGSALWLDLGKVGDLAVVSVNGHVTDTLWHAPYRTLIGGFLKPGKNTVEVKVTNKWTNRIAGDMALPADQKILSPGPPPFGGGGRAVTTGPPPAGLMGPVRLLREDW